MRGTLPKKRPHPHPPYEARRDILPGEIGSVGLVLKSVMFTNFLYVGTGHHPVRNTCSLFVSSIIANQIYCKRMVKDDAIEHVVFLLKSW